MQPEAVTLPPGFAFSQSSLQDFVECPRRFELRYLLKLAWPAIQSEPVQEIERSMQMGVQFHKIAHQRLLGLSNDILEKQVSGADLEQWWDNFSSILDDREIFSANTVAYPETSLQASFGTVRLVAKYDLLLVDQEGRLTIIDWKTSPQVPRREWLARRLQTRLYPFLLVEAGYHLRGNHPVAPSLVEMIYCYLNEPAQPLRFAYSDRQYTEDSRYLAGLIEQVKRLIPEAFPLTTDEKHCHFCVYRSLCDRGVRAMEIDGSRIDPAGESVEDIIIDFENITEIGF